MPLQFRHLRLEPWTRAHAALMLLGFAAAIALRTPWPLVLLALASFAALWRVGRGAYTPAGPPGVAHAITALRLAVTLALPSLAGAYGPILAAIVLGVLLLDGLDGWIARRTGTSSEFGALFDMETDALLVLVVGFELFRRGGIGSWVLVAGPLRYFYVLCVAAWAPRGGEMPRSRWGRFTFAILILGLAAALATPNLLGRGAAAMGIAMVVASFARSFYWSYGPRPAESDVVMAPRRSVL